jgi:hypothetical protein
MKLFIDNAYFTAMGVEILETSAGFSGATPTAGTRKLEFGERPTFKFKPRPIFEFKKRPKLKFND